jgi:hypothetical protein
MELCTDPAVHALVFGRSDSGKSLFAMKYASAVLRQNPDSVCLVLGMRPKAARKLIRIEDQSIADRILHHWITDKVSLLEACSSLHKFQDEPLELLIVEDILDYVRSYQVHAAIAHIKNAISVWPGCRLLVTMTPRKETAIGSFRVSMSHFVSTWLGSTRIGKFDKSLRKTNKEIIECVSGE